jgi:flavorubredoxin
MSESDDVMPNERTNAGNVERTTMPASVLVAYATRHGSTQEVAEADAATLRECGLEVDIQPMRQLPASDLLARLESLS